MKVVRILVGSVIFMSATSIISAAEPAAQPAKPAKGQAPFQFQPVIIPMETDETVQPNPSDIPAASAEIAKESGARLDATLKALDGMDDAYLKSLAGVKTAEERKKLGDDYVAKVMAKRIEFENEHNKAIDLLDKQIDAMTAQKDDSISEIEEATHNRRIEAVQWIQNSLYDKMVQQFQRREAKFESVVDPMPVKPSDGKEAVNAIPTQKLPPAPAAQKNP